MILEKVKKSSELIDRYIFAKNNYIEIKEMNNIEDSLKSITTNIDNLVKIVQAINIHVGELAVSNDVLLFNIEKVKEGINDFRNSELIKSYINQINIEVERIENLSLDRWKKYYYENYDGILGTLNVLKNVLGDNEIKTIAFNINKFNRKWPVFSRDIEELENFKILGIEKIKQLNMDKQVEDFLIKITSGMATLLDVNNSILVWLDDNNARESINLKIRSIQ